MEVSKAPSEYPPPQVNPYGRADEEIADVAQRELRRQKRMKCFIYLAAFIVFQIGIITLFSLTIMKFRTPRFRVRSATFGTFDVSTLDTNPSFNIQMNAELGIKNTNFGHFRYQNSTVEFFYRGTRIGEAFIPRARAKARSTRKVNVVVNLSSANVPSDVLTNDFRNGGVIPISSQGSIRGRVRLMLIMKKRKTANMNCTMGINISSRQLQNITCR